MRLCCTQFCTTSSGAKPPTEEYSAKSIYAIVCALNNYQLRILPDKKDAAASIIAETAAFIFPFDQRSIQLLKVQISH
jgi:hypothetical protein